VLGLGPVFAYEWLTSTRRWQGYALRSLFVAGLLAALIVVWVTKGVTQPATIRGLAALGESFFLGVVGTQLTLVLLAAPAATAGAICLDRARGTMTHLLVTDLSNREIVLGKLAARLGPVLGLLGATLPFVAILSLLGGVDPDALVGAFFVTLGVAFLGCSLALVFSLWATKTHEALLGTYAVLGLCLLGDPMVSQFNRGTGMLLATPPMMTNPYMLAFAPYVAPGTVNWSDDLAFLGVCLALSCGLATLAVVRVRAVCTRDVVRTKARIWAFIGPFGERLGRWERVFQSVPGPSLDLNPVLWREWHRNQPSRWSRVVGGLFVGLATIFSLIAIATGTASTAAWVNGLQVSIGLLLFSVSSATSLAEERVRGSLDVLMATPLSTREIVLGKWLGTFRLVPPLAILAGVVVFGAAGGVVDRGVAALFVASYVLVAGAAVTSLGIAMAIWHSRLGRAVGLTVTLYVLVAVGWLFMALAKGPSPGFEDVSMGSPFFWTGQITFDCCNGQGALKHMPAAIFWLFITSFAALGFLKAGLATFNRCLGRVETAPAPLRTRRRSPVAPIAAKPIG
jgi:ABC-type transport system involved in multi-copper enzyme maturation permease subunit